MKKGPLNSLKGVNCILGPQRQISRTHPAKTPLMKDKIEELETSQLMYMYHAQLKSHQLNLNNWARNGS